MSAWWLSPYGPGRLAGLSGRQQRVWRDPGRSDVLDRVLASTNGRSSAGARMALMYGRSRLSARSKKRLVRSIGRKAERPGMPTPPTTPARAPLVGRTPGGRAATWRRPAGRSIWSERADVSSPIRPIHGSPRDHVGNDSPHQHTPIAWPRDGQAPQHGVFKQVLHLGGCKRASVT